jgi:hypothetical protein
MLYRHSADAQQQRDLRVRTLAEQFVVRGRPPVPLGIENGNVSGPPPCCHALDASIQPTRQPPICHGAQEPIFVGCPMPSSHSPIVFPKSDLDQVLA